MPGRPTIEQGRYGIFLLKPSLNDLILKCSTQADMNFTIIRLNEYIEFKDCEPIFFNLCMEIERENARGNIRIYQIYTIESMEYANLKVCIYSIGKWKNSEEM